MKNLDELFPDDSQEKSAVEGVEVPQEENQETQLEKKEVLDEETLETVKVEIAEMMKAKVEGFKSAAMAGSSESIEINEKALSELDLVLEMKKNELVAKFGDSEMEKIEGVISEISESVKKELSEIDHYASNVRNTEQMLRNQGAMKEGMQEMGRAKLEVEGKRINEQRKNFLESNGINSEGLDEFAMGEKAKELRGEMKAVRDVLESRRVDLGMAHKGIMNNPDGELAGLKELEQSTRPAEEPKKKTFGDKIKGIFGI